MRTPGTEGLRVMPEVNALVRSGAKMSTHSALAPVSIFL